MRDSDTIRSVNRACDVVVVVVYYTRGVVSVVLTTNIVPRAHVAKFTVGGAGRLPVVASGFDMGILGSWE